MKVVFWGTRGSIASPGEDTVKYGGNTTCLEVRLSNNQLIILDAGTGIRRLGMKLIKNKESDINIFLTHPHWDHIQGFPFFTPMYLPGYKIVVHGWPTATRKVRHVITDQMEGTYFPVNFTQLSADIKFQEIKGLHLDYQGAKLSFLRANHPVICHSIKIEEGNRKFVFMTDNELKSKSSLTKVTGWEEFVDFCKDIDLLVHDAQFTTDEFEAKTGWGHSSYLDVLELAKQANVKKVVLFHHDPEHTDKDIDDILSQCQNIISRNGYNLECMAAWEGLTIEI